MSSKIEELKQQQRDIQAQIDLIRAEEAVEKLGVSVGDELAGPEGQTFRVTGFEYSHLYLDVMAVGIISCEQQLSPYDLSRYKKIACQDA
jgi:hypothetical protein